MSRLIEQHVMCPDCNDTFIGYGRGSNAANRAYSSAMRLLRSHQCPPFQQPDLVPRLSSTDLNSIIRALHEAMPDVTITRHKV